MYYEIFNFLREKNMSSASCPLQKTFSNLDLVVEHYWNCQKLMGYVYGSSLFVLNKDGLIQYANQQFTNIGISTNPPDFSSVDLKQTAELKKIKRTIAN